MTTGKLYCHTAQTYWTVSERLFSVRVNKDESLDAFSKINQQQQMRVKFLRKQLHEFCEEALCHGESSLM